MIPSRPYIWTWESWTPGPRRQTRGWKNGHIGTLGSLASDDVPLQKKVEFNIDGELNLIYAQLLECTESSGTNELMLDLHMLFHALGMKGNNPVVIYSRLVHDILSREISRYNRTREISGKIDAILEPETYTDRELSELTSKYAKRDGSMVRISKSGALFLIHYIDQIASEQGYYWNNERWQGYQNEQRIVPWKKRKK